ncbi:hypothetical protein OAU81_00245, partial [bacterium]|nr:hypothetical protein [bacterium]
QLDKNEYPSDRPVSYKTIGTLSHTQLDKNESPSDRPINYKTIGTLSHTQLDKNEYPSDRPVSYKTITKLEHSQYSASDTPIDLATSYKSVAIFEHYNINTTDISVSYHTIQTYDHFASRDMSTSYSSIKQFKDYPWTDLGVSYASLYQVSDVTSRDQANMYVGMSKFKDTTYRQQATSYGGMSRYQTLATRDLTVNYRSLTNVSEPIKIEMLSTTVSMQKFNVFARRDMIQSYTSMHVAKQYKHAGKFSVYNTTKAAYPERQQNRLSIYNTLKTLQHYQSSDNNTGYTTTKEISLIRGDNFKSYRGVDNISYTGPDESPVSYNSLTDFKSLPLDNPPVSYTTTKQIVADPHAFVFCDNDTYTFGASTVAVDTTLDNYYMPRNTYGVNKVRLIFLPNELELITPTATNGYPSCDCSYPYNVRVSDIKLILDDETEYDLNTPGVLINNSSTHCPVSSHHVSQLFDGELMTTFDQLTSFSGSFWTEGHMIIEIHLPETAPIRWVDVAPGGYDDVPRNWPGHVRIDGYYPGVDDWFCTYAKAHYRIHVPDFQIHNSRPDVWTVGSYMRFPTVRNNELHEYNHRWKREILTSCA